MIRRTKKGLGDFASFHAMRHLAAALEDDALVHAETRGQDIAPEDGGPVDLDAIFGSDVSPHLAADNHNACVDLSLNARVLADNQGVGGKNLATKGAVDPY